jgi:hypothetical protein
MNRITFRIAIALLIFVVGVATVSLWFLFRRDVEKNKSEPTQNANQIKSENELKDENNDWEYNKTPKVKWVYIRVEEKHIEESLINTSDGSLRYFRDVVIFYENGVWSRVGIVLTRGNSKWKIVEVSDDFIMFGNWDAVKKGKIKIEVEKCQFSTEDIPTDGGTKLQYPFIEKWLIENSLGQKESLLTNTYGTTYRLLNRSEINKNNLEELFYAPFQISDKKSVRLQQFSMREKS